MCVCVRACVRACVRVLCDARVMWSLILIIYFSIFKLFVRPTFGFMKQKEKFAKGNKISEKKLHLGSVSKFWYHRNH